LHRGRLLVMVIAVIAIVTTAATRASAPVVATHTAAAVAAGLDFFLFGRITSPAGGQLGRLDFLASTRRGRRSRGGTRTRHSGTHGRLVQRALLGITSHCGL